MAEPAPALLAGSAPAKKKHSPSGFTALLYKAVVEADDEQWARAAAAALAERGNESVSSTFARADS